MSWNLRNVAIPVGASLTVQLRTNNGTVPIPGATYTFPAGTPANTLSPVIFFGPFVLGAGDTLDAVVTSTGLISVGTGLSGTVET